MSADSVTFEELAERNRLRMERQGLSCTPQTVEMSVLQMMSALGELATLSYRTKASISNFEREEIAAVLGKLAVAITVLGEAFEVDVGAAAVQQLEEESHTVVTLEEHSKPRPRGSQPPAPAESASAPIPVNPSPTPANTTQSAAPQHESLVLSPTSNHSFFDYVDQLSTFPKGLFEQANLKWIAPRPDGTVEELIPGGAHIDVDYDDLPEYLRCVQRYRDQRTTPHTAQRKVEPEILVKAPGYDPDREAKLFSPTHFSNGLFSPMARVPDFIPAEVRPPVCLNDASHVQGPTAAAEVPPPRQPSQSRPMQGAYSADEFWRSVERIRRGEVYGPQIAQLGLTFSYPEGDRVIELTKDGIQIMVTSNNANEFLRLLENRSKTVASHANGAGKVHRSNSIRRLEVAQLPVDNNRESFSPSHFSHGLFAPYEAKSTFYVDYDESEKTLPPFLKEQRQQARRNSYLNAVRNRDYETIGGIIREVKANPAAVDKYGVVFCVPSSLEPASTEEERTTGLHALYPGSTLQAVAPAQQGIFLALVRQYFKEAA